MRLVQVDVVLPPGRRYMRSDERYRRIPSRLAWIVPLILGSFLVVFHSVKAQPISERIANGIGVAAHRPKDTDLDRIRALGVSIVRADLNWEATEKTPGQYDFASYLRMAKAMRERGLRPMFILDYSNSLYMDKVLTRRHGNRRMQAAAPATQRAVAAYAAWAAAAVRAFSAYDPIWEIWNEPDIAHFWPPAPDADAYALLLSSACAAMRKVSPGVTLVGPAAAKPPSLKAPYPPFLYQLLRSNAVACLDGISVHPYQNRGLPDLDLGNWSRLRTMITSNVPHSPPIINSEWGISSLLGVSEHDQALYLVRSLVLNLAAGVGMNIWYQWRDEGTDPNDDQQHFGLTSPDGNPKPAGLALRTFLSEVGKERFLCMVPTGIDMVAAAFAGEDSSKSILVVWSLRDRVPWALPAGMSVERMVSLTGENEANLTPLEISTSPVYLHLRSMTRMGERRGATEEICEGYLPRFRSLPSERRGD